MLRQLKDLIQLIEKMNRYLLEEDGKMEPAAMRDINVYLRYYYNKMLKAHLTRQEWKECTRLLKEQPIHKIDTAYESSRLGKTITRLKNWSGSSYPINLMIDFLLNKVFERFVRPRIISSYNK